MNPERVAIVGSREPSQWAQEDVVAQITALPPGTIVISGGAVGIDTLAYRAAVKRGLRTEIFHPEYARYDARIAPKVRNTIMAAICTRAICYTAGSKGGTHDFIRQMRRFDKPFKEMQR